MIRILYRVFVFVIGGLVLTASGARADRVATGSARLEANGGGFCVLGMWDNATYNVFGSPINFGTASDNVFCNGFNCQTTPDSTQFSYTFGLSDVAGLPTPHATVPFVVSIHGASGTLASAIGADIYTFDGQSTWIGSDTVSQIPGCPITGTFDVYEGSFGLNAFRTATTDPGTDVAVNAAPSFTDPVTGVVKSADVGVTFANVTGGGSTLVTATSSAAGAISSNFSVNIGGFSSVFFDVSTTATFSGSVTICQHYDDADNDGFIDGTQIAETDLHILHGEGGTFVDRTVSQDVVNNVICAQVSSLSPFVIAVDVTSTTTTDSVVLPITPVKVTIAKNKTAVTKVLSLKVVNANLTETAGHTIRLAVTDSTCPSSLLRDSSGQPVDFDFDGKTSGAQNSILVTGGANKTAKLSLRIVATDFTSPNAKSPARCTLTVTASTVVGGTVIDPSAANNAITISIDVIDKNDF